MTADEIFQEVSSNFLAGRKRKFLPGLLIAMLRFFGQLDALGGKFGSAKAFYRKFPRVRERKNKGGEIIGAMNTLVVRVKGGKNASIRPHYNDIEAWFRSEKKRFDYPGAAPHATQAWSDYEHWIDAILALSPDQATDLEERVKRFVLATLPAQEIDPLLIKRDPPRFLKFIEDFDLVARKNEINGAAYQGVVFGYVRADAPHLQVEVGKLHTGSKREGRVGDIDARDGVDLVLTAEVKQHVFSVKDLAEVSEFAKLVGENRALGLVVALDFVDGSADALRAQGLEPISKADLRERVRVWDPLKQRIATNALLYYVGFREKNSALFARIQKFLADVDALAAVPVHESDSEANGECDASDGAGQTP